MSRVYHCSIKAVAHNPNREFKAGNFAAALDKYQKALRYLDQHPVLPDDAPKEQVDAFKAA